MSAGTTSRGRAWARPRRLRGSNVLLRLDGSGPAYQQIYRALRGLILAGDLPRGSRLPATRAIAGDLGASRNIVLLAYRHLAAEGYVGGRTGSGTYVAPALPEDILAVAGRARVRAERVAPRLSAFGARLVERPRSRGGVGECEPLRYDFRYGLPAADAFPFALWRRLVATQARLTSPESFRYGAPEGHGALRHAIVDYLRRSRGVQCVADQVVITNGSQQALDLAARILVDPGDLAVIEEPHYPGAREAFRGAGARLCAVPVDQEGLDVARLARVGRRARVVSVTPSHQFPTGGVMSLARRLALLRWADETGAYVIEDDYESEYRYARRPVEAIQGLDRRGRVLYLGTLSKILFPALRLGYAILPEALVGAFREAKWYTDRHTPTFLQEVLARFIRDGHFERHVRRARAVLAGRRAALLEAVRAHLGDQVEVVGGDAGMHVVMWIRSMRAGTPLEALIARAARAGVGLYSVAPYYLRPPRRAGLVLGYAGLSEAAIRTGIERFSTLLR